jgi:hypothetical protein
VAIPPAQRIGAVNQVGFLDSRGRRVFVGVGVATSLLVLLEFTATRGLTFPADRKFNGDDWCGPV